MVFASIGPVGAQDVSYTVNNIAASAEGGNAIEARDAAMKQARRNAFDVLVSRMLESQGGSATGLTLQPDDSVIASMVDSFQINREKLSRDRYMASVNVTFNQQAVQRYVGRRTTMAIQDQSYGQPRMAATQGPRVLLLPWYQPVNGSAVLWSYQNPWLMAWQQWDSRNASQGRSIVIPRGDTEDISIFNPRMIFQADPNRLQLLMERYNATDVFFSVVSDQPYGMAQVNLYKIVNGQPQLLNRAVREVTTGAWPALVTAQIPAIEGNLLQMRQAANPQAVQSSRSYNPNTMNTPSVSANGTQPQFLAQAQAVSAAVQLSNLQEWIKVKAILDTIADIRNMRVQSLSARQATVDFSYNGDIASLRNALATRGLYLYENPIQNTDSKAPYIIRKG